MIPMQQLPKLKRGDKVAILSPSFAAPGKWPHMYELGLKRVREVFDLEPVAYPTTAKIGASAAERSADLIAAFQDPEIKAVITSLGGDDQITYVKNLPAEPFAQNPKPFFGYSDNTHLCNFLFLHGVPSYYGAALHTQFAMQGEMDEYTISYIKHALFETGEFELLPSETFNDMGLNWNDPSNMTKRRIYEPNDGWHWDGSTSAEGQLWGGCFESIDEILRHAAPVPTLDQFNDIVLMLESSEEIPSADYLFRILRAFGERGILQRVRGVLIGRPKAWEYNKMLGEEEKKQYRLEQRETILRAVRIYNQDIPVVQNLNFGHTDPQIPMPYGNLVRIDSSTKQIFVQF